VSDFPHEVPQSGHGGGRGITIGASHRNQDGGGETVFVTDRQQSMVARAYM